MSKETPTKKALQKIQDQINCGICFEPYKEPKLLECRHVFCAKCLRQVVESGWHERRINCPHCRKITTLPQSGISGLPAAFHLEAILEVQKILKTSPTTDQCPSHPEKEADFYCEQCQQLLCSFCLIPAHRDHKYDLLHNSLAKHEKVIDESLKPLKEQISILEKASNSVTVQCSELVKQTDGAVKTIQGAMIHICSTLDKREKELIEMAQQIGAYKAKCYVKQQDEFELQLAKLKSCLEFVSNSRSTCSPGKMIKMTTEILKIIQETRASVQAKCLMHSTQMNIEFTHNLPENIGMLKQFGELSFSHTSFKLQGQGLKVAMKGCKANIILESIDRIGSQYYKEIGSLKCELVCANNSGIVTSGTVMLEYSGVYKVTYQAPMRGEYHLNILNEENTPIFKSPQTIKVIPDFSTISDTIEGLKDPIGIKVTQEEEVIVAEYSSNCISTFDDEGTRLSSFGTHGNAPGELYWPEGVEIDEDENILVADFNNHRIQKFSYDGQHLQTVGAYGNKPLYFKFPRDILSHPHTKMVYIADWGNNRIQVLNPDLSYSFNFGRYGSDSGLLHGPCSIANDKDGLLYVADCENHRIQVFTGEGLYLRRFGKEGAGNGELKWPISIAIGPHNAVYVGERGNHRISVFFTNGDFIGSFGSPEIESPSGLAVDQTGMLYVSDTKNCRICIFS